MFCSVNGLIYRNLTTVTECTLKWIGPSLFVGLVEKPMYRTPVASSLVDTSGPNIR